VGAAAIQLGLYHSTSQGDLPSAITGPCSHFRPPPLLQFELQGPDAPERLPASVAAALPALQESYDAGREAVVQVRSRFD